MIRAYTEGKFSASRVSTIGVDFYVHTLALPRGKIRLSIWDMAGQDRFQFMRSSFYPGSRAAALVYDVTVPESLERLAGWRDEILEVVPDEKFVVVGNKIDLVRVQNPRIARLFAGKIGAPYCETSARTAEGIEEVFKSLAMLTFDQGA